MKWCTDKFTFLLHLTPLPWYSPSFFTLLPYCEIHLLSSPYSPTVKFTFLLHLTPHLTPLLWNSPSFTLLLYREIHLPSSPYSPTMIFTFLLHLTPVPWNSASSLWELMHWICVEPGHHLCCLAGHVVWWSSVVWVFALIKSTTWLCGHCTVSLRVCVNVFTERIIRPRLQKSSVHRWDSCSSQVSRGVDVTDWVLRLTWHITCRFSDTDSPVTWMTCGMISYLS